MTAFQPLEKQSTADKVFEQLLSRIAEGEWAEGDRTPSENEVREGLGVSRDSIREAVKRLSAMGLLRSEQGKGTFVRKIDTGFYLNMLLPSVFLIKDNGLHILQFIKAIQVECARIAAEKATAEDLNELKGLLSRMNAETDAEAFFGWDNAFHACLCRITGNELFIKAAQMSSGILHVCLKAIVEIHGSRRSIAEHSEILACIERRDGKSAARVMVSHYDTIMARLKDYLAR